MKKIDSTIKEFEREELIRTVKGSKFGIALVIGLITLLAFLYIRGADKTIKTSIITGYIVGIHQNQSQLGSTETKLSVKLNTGKKVLITLPSNQPIKTDTNIEIFKNITENGKIRYKFNKYLK